VLKCYRKVKQVARRYLVGCRSTKVRVEKVNWKAGDGRG